MKNIFLKITAFFKRMGEGRVSGTQYAIPFMILAGLLSARISFPQYAEEIQHRVFDMFQRIKPREYQPVPVHIIDIDDASLEKYGQWPWPRTLLAELVRKLSANGAAVIAFDSVFAEKDRHSPDAAMLSWPDFPEKAQLRKVIARMPDNDSVFAKSLKDSNAILGFSLTSEFKDSHSPAVKAFYAFSGEEQPEYVADFSGATLNLPVLEKAAAGNGSFTFISEADGVIRQVPLVMRKNGTYVPSLSAEALRVAQGAKGYTIKFSGGSGEGGGHTGISRIKIGHADIPTDAWGRIWVYFTKKAPGRMISAKEILDGSVNADILEGTINIIGTSAAGLKDLRVTPLDPVLPGVEVHANVIEQALLDEYLLRPDWADGAELIYTAAAGILLVLLLPVMGALASSLFSIFAVAAVALVSWYLFSSYGFLIDPVCPSAAVAAAGISSLAIGYLKTETEKKYVRAAFSHYMHPKMVEELAKSPEKLKLGGEMRNMTILFCDIRGFTTISEQYDSVGLTKVINRFLTPMTSVIMERKGCIDKYIGDCIMAFWNAPIDDGRHIANACESALVMQEELAKLNIKWKAEAEKNGTKYLPINIGVGLNTDDCCVGNLGSDQRFNYSVLGDGVNLASRLEGQSKNYGVKIVIGPKTHDGAEGFAMLELDLIKVKGKTRPVNIFALLGRADVAESQEFIALKENHDNMMRAYRSADFESAEKFLELCRNNPYGLEKLYDLYASRIASFRENPPEPDWDGTYTATSK